MSGLVWSQQWTASAVWIAEASGWALAGLGLVSAVVGRATGWGRDFRLVAGRYFRPGRTPAAWGPPLTVVAMVVLATLDVRVGVLISYAQNGIYDGLQDLNRGEFDRYLEIFGAIATLYVAESMLAYWVGQAFVIRWRRALTERMLADWLDGRAYQRGRYLDAPVDNPDQRIQEDVDTFTSDSQDLGVGAVNAVVSLFAFTAVLWQLSAPLPVFGLTVPRAMVFGIYLYVVVATVVAFRIGRPLVALSFLKEGLTASFRYALVRLRDNAESVAFAQAEPGERRTLDGRFGPVIGNAWAIVRRTVRFQAFNLAVSQLSVLFPFLVQAPRFFRGTIQLGDIQQTATAIGAVHDALSFFRNSYDTFAAYRATLARLAGLLEADRRARELPAPVVEPAPGRLDVHDLTVRLPDGSPLVNALTLALRPGDRLLVTGPSGVGKTTLLRALAGLWPYAEGTVARPTGERALFLPQQPYLPLGTLRDTLGGPEAPDRVLEQVALPQLAGRLDEQRDWTHTLSPGERQRLAFARVLVGRPDLVFCDESTSALDEGLELTLYRTLARELPEAIVVSIGHRATLVPLHTHQLRLLPGGSWLMMTLRAEWAAALPNTS